MYVETIHQYRHDCVAKITLYGAHHKDQRKNYIKVPAGTKGETTYRIRNDHGVCYVLCSFRVNGKDVHVKCTATNLIITS